MSAFSSAILPAYHIPHFRSVEPTLSFANCAAIAHSQCSALGSTYSSPNFSTVPSAAQYSIMPTIAVAVIATYQSAYEKSNCPAIGIAY